MTVVLSKIIQARAAISHAGLTPSINDRSDGALDIHGDLPADKRTSFLGLKIGFAPQKPKVATLFLDDSPTTQPGHWRLEVYNHNYDDRLDKLADLLRKQFQVQVTVTLIY